MKTLIAIILIMHISITSSAQNRNRYRIKVVERNRLVTKGTFYAVTDNELILVRYRKDTIKIKTNNVKALYINRRGVVVPFIFVGAAVFLAIASKEVHSITEVLNPLLIGIPAGAAAGIVSWQLFANKRYYRKLEPADFPLIKPDLERFTQVIIE